jgi:DNA-binding CsgD family transcriptional regulator/tetratricopeptide (TPR) repeat protein
LNTSARAVVANTELLERATQLDDLEEILSRVASAGGQLIFLGGEAGVGKTSLVQTFCARARATVQVLIGACDALSTPRPLGPLLDVAHDVRGVLAQLVAADAPRHLFFRAALDALTASGPILFIIEDAHWADEATLDLLRYLGRRVGTTRALVIVTYRDDEVGPAHPLRAVLGDLATTAAVRRIMLPPLSEAAVRQLAADSDLDPVELHRRTGGNSFFVTEVLASEGENVPASIGDAVLARAARLSPEARAVLEIAAVIGATIAPGLLQRVAGPVLDEADECITGGLLLGTGNVLAFRHELAREAILASIAPPRRRLLHARVLAELRVAPEAERDLALLAHHAEAAWDQEAVLEFAISAAEQAAALHAHREAAAQYARALRFAANLPAAERACLFEGRSVACYLSDQGEEAIAARQAALDIWRKLGNSLKEGESLRWLSRCYWYQGRGAEAAAAAIAALEILEPLPPGPQLAMAYSNLAQLRMLDDDLEGTLLWGNRAIALAEQLGDSDTLVHALINVGTARNYTGEDRGLEQLTRGLDLALANGLFDNAGRALANLAWTGLSMLKLDEADRRLTTGMAYAIEHDLDNYRWYLLATRAALRVRQGAWDAAEADVRHLLRQPMASPLPRIVALTALGQVGARRGSPEAAAALDEALALAERTGQLMRLGPVRAARAEAALLEGDKLRARSEVQAVQELVFTRGSRWQRGEISWRLWQTGERDIPTDGLAEPYALLLAGEHAAAAAAWRALGCPYEEACAQTESDDPDSIRLAVASFERLGAVPAMKHAIRRLRALGVRDVPQVRRGPRPATRANRANLTRRQAEVLDLVAAGNTNTEIATRLFVSPKTVEQHVSAILAKLGTRTRREAIRRARELGALTPN